MANLNITPPTVLLTSGQAATFEARAEAKAVSVNWSTNPQYGSLLPPPDKQATSATYVAPPVAGAQTVTVIASTGSDSASATIFLTPDAITVLPAKVELSAGEKQHFVHVVAGPLTAPDALKPTWILSPPLGDLDQNGWYTAPDPIRDTRTVTVTAASGGTGKRGFATVILASPPWTGLGVTLLGVFISLVFLVVFLMVLLWPPALPSPDTAKANRIEAEKTLEEKTTAREQAQTAKDKAEVEEARALAATNKGQLSPNATTFEEAKAEAGTAIDRLERAKGAEESAENELKGTREDEKKVNSPDVKTDLGEINRELDLLWLVLLAGALGSFLHMAQSYTDYIGNEKIKSRWAWWYYFRPFIGAGLALILYAAVRGGFMAIVTGSNAKASELNPFGVVALAALVGMFSKAATMKLGEVFDTLFRTQNATESKDKLVPSSPASSPPSGATVGGAATSGATK